MKAEHVMTERKLQKWVETFRQVFDVVSLRDAENLEPSAQKAEVPETRMEVVDGQTFLVISKEIDCGDRKYVMELKKSMDENYAQALYEDVLTGAYNRRYYEEKMKKTVLNAAVAVIDMDDFKIYNDTYGHHIGDTVLDVTAQAIKSRLKEGDLLVRYGGDEFILILDDVGEDELEQRLRDIQKKVSDTQVPGYEIRLSVSIGAILTDGTSLEAAVEKADKLMYLAKKQKNMVMTQRNFQNGKLPEQAKNKPQLLIVDDSEITRSLLTEILERDYRILEAADGEECIRKIEQYGTGIEAVLLDIVMPKMNGFEVLDWMEEKKWLEDIPVIVISSESAGLVIQKAFDRGVSDYISSPFDVKVIYQRVTNIVNLYAKQRRLISMVFAKREEEKKV